MRGAGADDDLDLATADISLSYRARADDVRNGADGDAIGTSRYLYLS
jgi:hypothetical protein